MEKRVFKRFGETEAAQCRWSEYAEEIFGDWDVIWDNSQADYQGSVEFLAHKDGKFGYLSYSYGSCSGCDSWEDMEAEKVREEFQRMAEFFEDVHALKKFADQVNYDKGFKEAIAHWIFLAQLEEELSK